MDRDSPIHIYIHNYRHIVTSIFIYLIDIYKYVTGPCYVAVTLRTGVTAVVAALAPVPASAAPPPGADPALHAWFERQHSVAGAWCCDLSDGAVLAPEDWRASGTGYQARVNGEWRDIPPHALRDPAGGPNPTGSAVLWQRGGMIFCFAPGAML